MFDRASDFRGAAGFIGGIERVEMLTDDPVRVGTRFKETRIMFKREATEEMEVTAFDPPNGYTLGAESCGCRYRTQFTFLPNATGTDVTMEFRAEPLTLMAKIMSFVFRLMMKGCMKLMEKDLDDLKRTVESER